MKTLVIHPSDETTDFLSIIYLNKGWTVIRDNRVSKSELIEQIKSHDRIIMLGHGNDYGLIGLTNERLIISSKLIYLLRQKYCIGIWCHANIFFERYGLIGKYTGMIISEVDEALRYDIKPIGRVIDESNRLFADLFRLFVNDEITLNEFIQKYDNPENPIINFNRVRIFEKRLELPKN